MEGLIGRELGHYRLTRKLGAGGFADVYLAEHIYLNRLAAVKLLHTNLVSGDMQRFLDEAKTIAQLDHQHIVRVLDFGIEQIVPYLVMDYAPNGTLRQRHPTGTQVPLSLVVTYIKQLADALQYAHDRRLIHRDVKPENVLLGSNNDLLLGDFGAALLTRTSLMLKTQNIIGTVSYMAPEQLRGRPVAASDQYALGVMVYEWLSGYCPFEGSVVQLYYLQVNEPPPSLRSKGPTISPVVEQVVMKALAKQPEQRFATIQAFAEALEQASQQVQASPLFLPGNADLQRQSQATVNNIAPSPLPPTMYVSQNPLPATQVHDTNKVAKSRYSRRMVLNSIAVLAASASIGSAAFWLIHNTSQSSAQSKKSTSKPTPTATPIPTKSNAVYTYRGHQSEVYTAAWSPDSQFIASAGGDKKTKQGDTRVHVWNALTGLSLYMHLGHSQRVRMVAWSPVVTDGRIASASEDHTARVWYASDNGNPPPYTGHRAAVMALTWAPDGTDIASASLDLTAQVWDAAFSSTIRTYISDVPGDKDTVNVTPIAWSPNGKMIASTSMDRKSVNVWEAETRKTLYIFPSTSITGALAWSSDSQYVATGHYNNEDTVRIWNVSKENPIQVFPGTSDDLVYTVAWSPDGRYVAAGYQQNEVRIWDRVRNTQVLIYQGHRGPIMSVQWSPSGQYIASCGFDGTVQIWEPLG